MVGEHLSGAGAPSRATREPLKTHSFGWDPLERVRLASTGRIPFGALARPKSALMAAGGVALIVLTIAGASILGAGEGDAQSAASEREQGLAAREASIRQREAQLSEFDRRKANAESGARDAERRLAELEARRTDLQREVAELTAPVAPAAGDERGAPSAGEDSATAANDPSPPDEDAVDGAVTASSPAGQERQARSSASVDAASDAESSAEPARREATQIALPPTAAGTRVFIHVPATDPAARARAKAVAAELRRRGVDVAEIRGVPRKVRRDAVRYYYDADREAVTTLQDAVRDASPSDEAPAQAQDFRGYRAPPRPGTLELWLS